MHALEVEHLLDVDVEDPRVGVGRAEHRGVQRRADRDVVDVPALAAQEPLVLDPLDDGAHQLAAHASASRAPFVVSAGSTEEMISAARSTALTMFW